MNLYVWPNCISADLDQFLYNVVGKSLLRILVLSNLTEAQAVSLNGMRPIPSYFVIVGSTHFVQDTYKMVIVLLII